MRITTLTPGSSGAITPITAYDNSKLWLLNGSLRATIEGSLDGANISWVQLTGTPVTYTTPTNQLYIEFNTTDLQTKTFRVYTNQGDPLLERYDDATFYHHPIDVIDDDANLFVTDVDIGLLNLQYHVTAGMYASWDTSRKNLVPSNAHGVGKPKDVYDLNTEVIIRNIPYGISTSQYTIVTVDVETSPGVWSTVETLDHIPDVIIGLSSPPRLTIDTLYRGYRSTVVESVTLPTTNGVSNMMVDDCNVVLTNVVVESNTHTINTSTYTDNVYGDAHVSATGVVADSNTHSINTVTYTDTINGDCVIEANNVSVISTIHTSSQVG